MNRKELFEIVNHDGILNDYEDLTPVQGIKKATILYDKHIERMRYASGDYSYYSHQDVANSATVIIGIFVMLHIYGDNLPPIPSVKEMKQPWSGDKRLVGRLHYWLHLYVPKYRERARLILSIEEVI